jgi:hypothetical protein
MFLYLVVGVGCGALRLSALAVALLTIIPAVVGAAVSYPSGWSQTLLMAFTPILTIECAYFVSLLAFARIFERKEAGNAASHTTVTPGAVELSSGKPQTRPKQ